MAEAQGHRAARRASRPPAAASPASLPLAGRSVALIFEKASTRTRLSFELAVAELGGIAVAFEASSSQLGRGEPIRDMARVLGRQVDCIVYRTGGHDRLEEMAAYAGVPVINGLSDVGHPCQVLADLVTLAARGVAVDGMRAAWIGDGNNMANSWIEAAALLGFELTLACPKGYQPAPKLLERVVQVAREVGAPVPRVRVVTSPQEAVLGVDVVSTDVWASMGQEQEAESRQRAFVGYCLDEALLRQAKAGAVVLHCLPAHRGEEISEAVLEGPQSAVWDQAENRLHAQKAVLCGLLGAR
jgi:ornithine carbamoyltransferase